MTRIRKFVFALFSIACIMTVAHGLYGQVQRIQSDTSDSMRAYRDAYHTLEELRTKIRRESHVLIITSAIPAPDFDFWFGMSFPTDVLVNLTSSAEQDFRRWGVKPPIGELRAALESSGKLLTRERMTKSLAEATDVIITDDGIDRDFLELLLDFREVYRENGWALFSR